MTGANYTGGKRNVARTRFRDSTRRVQKNHFGRRRLGILSRGLVNGTHHATEEETTSGISSILLEHAQREISRPSRSSPVQRTEARRAFILDLPSSTRSSTSGSNVACPTTRTLDYRSYSSLRAEVNRILEFSRTVGLCNYSTSPRQDVPASLASRDDSESGFDPLQRLNNSPSSSTSGSSSRQHTQAFISYTVQDSEILQMSQTETYRSNSLREATPHPEQAHEDETDLMYAEPMSNYIYSGHCNSESPAQSTSILDSPLGEDRGFPRVLESNLCLNNPPSPPFDPLEFSTSSLPPSSEPSPLPSSTTHGSLLSLRQVSHRAEAETTLLDFDEMPLPSTMSGSYEVGSSSRHGGCRHVTPDSDLASVSPLRYLPRSGLVHIVPTHLDPYSKADLIPDLLTYDDPWNVIGDMLDLPPIPSADATYFNSLRSHHTTGLLNEYVSSSPASSSSFGQGGIGEPSCTTQGEGTWSRAVHSDGDLLNFPDPWGVGNSHKTSRRATSLLLSRDSPKKVRSPARPFRSIYDTYPSRSPSPSFLAMSGNSPVVTEAPQSLLEIQAPPASSPGPLRDKSGLDLEESYSALVKTLSPSPCIFTPQRSKSPSPKNLSSLKESVSHSSGTLLSQRNEIIESVPVGFVPKVSPTNITATKAQLPRLEFPDLFKDEEDSFGVF